MQENTAHNDCILSRLEADSRRNLARIRQIEAGTRLIQTGQLATLWKTLRGRYYVLNRLGETMHGPLVSYTKAMVAFHEANQLCEDEDESS